MIYRGAITTKTARTMLLVTWMVSSLAINMAAADIQPSQVKTIGSASANDTLLIDIECSSRQTGSAFCNLRTDMQYSKFLNIPLTVDEIELFSGNEEDQHRADLMTIVRLAVEEFKFLSGVRLYWEITEQNLEELAIKLRLKGELPIAQPASHDRSTGHVQNSRALQPRRSSGHGSESTGILALFMPKKLRWNLGMDPNDLTVFGELNLNSHLMISGELGDSTQLGLYFKYRF
jgi:hypothetical protein